MTALKHLQEIASRFGASERSDLINHFWKMRTCIATARLFTEGAVVAESGIEHCFYLAAELTHCCIALITQPFTANIAGLFNYTPDALAMSTLGPCVVECKPSRENFDPEYRARCRAIETEFERHGLRYVVIDEHDVCGWNLVHNLGLLWRVKNAHELDAQAQRLRRIVESHGGNCSVDLVRRAGMSTFDISRALARGDVYCDLHRRINRSTTLRLEPFGDRRDVLSKLTLPFQAMAAAPAPALDWVPAAWAQGKVSPLAPARSPRSNGCTETFSSPEGEVVSEEG